MLTALERARAAAYPEGEYAGQESFMRAGEIRRLASQARVGRPLGIEGLPESGKSPSFAAAVGLMVYPQMAGLEYFGSARSNSHHHHHAEAGYAARVGRWLKDSF